MTERRTEHEPRIANAQWWDDLRNPWDDRGMIWRIDLSGMVPKPARRAEDEREEKR